MDVGAVERLLRSLAFKGLGDLEFRVPAEVDGFWQQLGFNSNNLTAPKANPEPFM